MKKQKNLGILVSAIFGFLIVIGSYLNYKIFPSNSSRIKIGATYMTMNNDFYKVLNNEIEKVVKENNDILYTRDPALDVNKQKQQIDSFIQKEVDGLSRSLLEKISIIPSSPEQIFCLSNLFFAILLFVIYARNQKLKKETVVRDWFAILEVFLLLATFVALQFSYNGLILLVFMDIFFSYTDFYTFREKRSWLFFILANFGALLLSNYDVLSLLVRTPELDVYIDVFPSSTRLAILFIKNCLVSLNIIVFIISLVTYIVYSVTENHKIEKELLMASQANTRLKEYVAVSEKIT